MSNFNDPKAAFEAETEDHGKEQSRAISMLSGGGEAGFAEGDAPLGLHAAGKEGRNVLGQTTLMIVIVAIVAAGSLYGMRVLQKDTPTNDKEDKALVAKLDNWLTKADSGAFAPDDATNPANLRSLMGDTSEVLRVLNIKAAEHQVPIEYVQKNPFTFTFDEGEANADAPYDPGMHDRALAARRQQLQAALSKYQVGSIMLGKRNVAMINGEMYQVGDYLGEFVVEEIQSMTVLLRAGQEKFTLSINLDETRTRSRKR